tara:strand:- start:1237 stop:2274 length:1038 start_codon:yes stop_codon:yes gene_type:complete
MNFALINNSRNPDMSLYFKAKKNINSKRLIFAANSFYWDEDQIYLSSISPKNKLSWHFIIDFIIGIYLAIKFKIKGIDCLLFDNAHISNIPLALVAYFLRLKLVFTIHDWIPHEGKMARATRLHNWVLESFLADYFIVFSSIETEVPFSVLKLSGFQSNFKKSKVSNLSFLFFGRIQPYKGLQNLIYIAEKVKREMPNAVINIIGEGQDKALDVLSKLSNVNVINKFISEDDLNSQLKKTTAVILPYDNATQSGVIIKSFSMGIPVIAFDVGALKYYVDNGSDGILVKHGNVKGFVEAMIHISENFVAFSNAAEKNFTKNYSERALVNQYEALLLTLGEKLEQNK